MERALAVVFAIALGAAPTAPVTADTLGQKVKIGVQSTKDAAVKVGDRIGDKAKDLKDRMLGRTSEGPGARHQDVRAAQQALKDKGHDPGMIDGRMGVRTRAAVNDYQRAEGLTVTGRLDDDTRAGLGVPKI